MKDNREYKRLQRLILALWFFILMVCISLAFLFSFQVKKLNQELTLRQAQLEGKIPYVKDGKNGLAGESVVGPRGEQGTKGDKGDTGSQGQQGVQGIQGVSGKDGADGKDGAVGPQGETGLAGRTVFQRTNLITGQEECRYSDSYEWQPIQECS